MINAKFILIPVLLSFMMLNRLTAQQSEITISNGDVEIAGTLVMAENSESPLVIMLTGSGAQDRDETIYGFKPFKLIADHLVEAGISSYRYDDRGIGGSSGNLAKATLDDLVSDVNAVVDYFDESPDYSFSEIILLGHSQGGIVSIKSAKENPDIDKLILMASPLVQLKDVISEQVSVMQKAMGKSEEEIATVLEFQDLVYETVRADAGWDELKAAYKELLRTEIAKLPEAQQSMITDFDQFAEAQFNAQVLPMKTPQMSSFLYYDPGEDLKELSIPVFALFGGKDTQVTPEQNYWKFGELCGVNNMDCTSQMFNDANHLFQDANTGLANEYATLPKKFTEGFLTDISEWIITGF